MGEGTIFTVVTLPVLEKETKFSFGRCLTQFSLSMGKLAIIAIFAPVRLRKVMTQFRFVSGLEKLFDD